MWPQPENQPGIMKELTFFQKYKLKYTNRAAYRHYKSELRHFREQFKLENIVHPSLIEVEKKDIYNFKHSGNSGDIIYGIPTMLGLTYHKPSNLYLHLYQPSNYEPHIVHPLGDVMLNTRMFEMLKPLMLYQSYIQECEVYREQPIDYDLDKFREYPILQDRGNIARWNMLVYPVAYDLNDKWIEAPKDNILADAILVARSTRYNAPGITYSFLSKYPKVYFVGVEEEYAEMHKQISHLQYLPVTNFLQLASYIASAKLFIGNQSFPFSLAEAMKVNRLLEMYFKAPNVNVYGTNGFDFCFQPHFEYLVKKRYEDL